jgi:predicted NBD/HSP70 family sugar kinase
MRRIYLHKVKSEVARSNTIRNINKQIVLNFVRERAPVSRADIARETALQRSTVSAIVDALVAEGLIEESGAGVSSGGRKPTLLRLRGGEPIAAAVDIEPSITTVAIADLAGKILAAKTFPTSPEAAETFDGVLKALKKFKSSLKKTSVEIGVSVPGLVDATTGTVSYVPYFGWSDWQLKPQLEEKINLPVRLDNDANAVALAELWFGKPEMHRIKNFVSLLVAEGIGTGIVFDGQVYRGASGAAGEFGHMILAGKSDYVCSCGSHQCWESFASDRATAYSFKILSGRQQTIDEILALRRGGNDAAAKTVVNRTVRYLGFGIANLIVGLSPEMVIISGKITALWNLIEPDLLAAVAENIRQKLPPTKIIASSLGDFPTLRGAISLSLVKKFASAT